nr:hypothetical protein CFP56_40298 [Quercus suber]
MNYWQIQKQDRTLSAASDLLIEDTDDPETNLLKTHKAKHPYLVILYAFQLAPSTSLNICTLQWIVTLRSLTLFVTQTVASSVSERLIHFEA